MGEELGQGVLLRSEALECERATPRSRSGAHETSLRLPPLQLRRFCALWWFAPLVRGPGAAG